MILAILKPYNEAYKPNLSVSSSAFDNVLIQVFAELSDCPLTRIFNKNVKV